MGYVTAVHRVFVAVYPKTSAAPPVSLIFVLGHTNSVGTAAASSGTEKNHTIYIHIRYI